MNGDQGSISRRTLGHLMRAIATFLKSRVGGRAAYLILLLPVLIVASIFIRREMEFGVIGQSAMAFAALLGAFSLIITQFQAISFYASVVARHSEFVEHAENCRKGDA